MPAKKNAALSFGQMRVALDGVIDDLRVADVDRDGIPEVVTTDSAAGIVRISFTDRKKPFAIGKTAKAADCNGLIGGIADFTGDDKPDLLIALEHATERMALLPGRGNGTFGAAKRFSLPLESDGSFDCFDSGDLDGDGDLDAVGHFQGKYGNEQWLVVAINAGKGKFVLKRIDLDDWHKGLAVGDLDGDGSAEFCTYNVFNDSIEVWKSGAKGKFVISQQFAGEADDLTFADLDGDERPDLFGTHYGNSWVRKFGNNGEADSPKRLPGDVWIDYGVAFGDVDGDGYPDAAAASPQGVALYRGARGARFKPMTLFSPRLDVAGVGDFDAASNIGIIDADRDGKTDIVAAQRFSFSSTSQTGNIIILKNGGKAASLDIENFHKDFALMRSHVLAFKGRLDYHGSNIDLRFNSAGINPTQSAFLTFNFSFTWAGHYVHGTAWATGEFIHQPGSQNGTLSFDLVIPTNVSVGSGYPPVSISQISLWDYNLVGSNEI